MEVEGVLLLKAVWVINFCTVYWYPLMSTQTWLRSAVPLWRRKGVVYSNPYLVKSSITHSRANSSKVIVMMQCTGCTTHIMHSVYQEVSRPRMDRLNLAPVIVFQKRWSMQGTHLQDVYTTRAVLLHYTVFISFYWMHNYSVHSSRLFYSSAW